MKKYPSPPREVGSEQDRKWRERLMVPYCSPELSFVGDVGCSGTSETTLLTHTIKAKTLAANGDSIEIKFLGTLAKTGSTKYFRVKLNGVAVFNPGGLAISSSDHWAIETFLIREAKASIRVFSRLHTEDASYITLVGFAVSSADTSSDLALTVTGQGGASNDIKLLSAKGLFTEAI